MPGGAERLRQVDASQHHCRPGNAGRGRVLADGEPIRGPGRDRMVMFQEPALFPWLDVLDNVMFGLKLKPGLAHSERREVAQYYLQLVGLRVPARLHPRAFRRHEAARGAGPRAGAQSARAADGRAVRGARRPHPRAALRRPPAIWQERRRRSCLSRTTCARPPAWATAWSCSRRIPGRIREEFKIPLPRPRDINSVDLAEHATEIMRALKGHLVRAGSRMKRRSRGPAVLRRAPRWCWECLCQCGVWSPVLVPSPSAWPAIFWDGA